MESSMMHIHNTWAIAIRLFNVQRKHGSPSSGKIRAHPAILSILNLFFCGYFDQYLKNDPAQIYFALFLTLELMIYTLCAIGSFSRNGWRVLRTSIIFPTTVWSRFILIMLSILRNPVCMGLQLTTSLFFIVFFHRSFLSMVFVATGYMLISIFIVSLISIAYLFMSVRSQSAAGLLVIVLFGGIISIATSFLFHLDSVLTSLPFLSWMIGGLRALNNGNALTALFDASLMLIVPLFTILVGIRFCR